MDGLLVVDKPSGPTSHDIVAWIRRAFGEERVGHTGTLDPLATGVLPLVLGRATRLARFVTAGSKCYRATITLGACTDTGDADGQTVGEAYQGPWPSERAVDDALEAFRGTHWQQPPRYSAKKIGGARSHRLARRHARQSPAGTGSEPPLPAPVAVTAHAITLVGLEGARVTLEIDCSAGFYVRSLAHDLGSALGTGAHLAALRRTRSAGLTLALAVALPSSGAVDDLERLASAVIPLSEMLPSLPRIDLTEPGERRVRHGQSVGANDATRGFPEGALDGDWYRLFGSGGVLLGVAAPEPSRLALHPSIVLV